MEVQPTTTVIEITSLAIAYLLCWITTQLRLSPDNARTGKIERSPYHLHPQQLGKVLISFTEGDLAFIDSLQFMNASLEKLVANLAKAGDGKFRLL